MSIFMRFFILKQMLLNVYSLQASGEKIPISVFIIY
jgi:hypothetical protein